MVCKDKHYHFVGPRTRPPWKPTHPLDRYFGDHDLERIRTEYPIGSMALCVKSLDESEFAGTTPNFTAGKTYQIVGHYRGQKAFEYPGQRSANLCLVDVSAVLLNDFGGRHGMSRGWLREYFVLRATAPTKAEGASK